MAVPTARFREQMQLLAEGAYRVLTEDDLHAFLDHGIEPPANGVLITFDDGYANTITTALPILEDLGLPALMAVCGGYLTDDLPRRVPHLVQEMADVAQVQAWIGSGRDIAAHGYTHQRLTGVSDLALRWQTAGDREVLTDVLGRTLRTFAYPYGACDARVQRAVAELYPAALSTDEHHRVDLHHPHNLPRIQIDPGWSLTAFQTALDSDADPATAQRAARCADTARSNPE
ncbi:polysaccharide deacetylase family protein [Nocardia sp. CA-107356]|uniref:polysaccharide deacetylase family protein n=1 Tax=Nocardia sp. CA-107356 TaxID=3239972 RepID=UPI003D92D9B3